MVPQLIVLILASFVPVSDEPDLAPTLRSAIETTKGATELLTEIKDAASADKAKPKLDEYGKQLEKVEKVLKPRPDRELTAAEMKLAKEYVKSREDMDVAHGRIFTKQKAVYKLLTPTDLFKHIESSQEAEAALQCQNIQKASLAYAVKSGEFPESLEVLIVRDPNTGTLPMFEGGPKAIRTPWGKPFEFKVDDDAAGIPRLRVWTVSPYGKGGTVIQWPPPHEELTKSPCL